MKNILGQKSVYVYRFPECRSIMKNVDEVLNDKRFYLGTTLAKTAQEILSPLQLADTFIVPSYPDGKMDLDSLYKTVTQYIIGAYQETVPGLETFPHQYCTQGSSEGIQKSLAELACKGVKEIYVLAGEYEGYKHTANGLGMTTIEVDPYEVDFSQLAPGHWFISNPSAIKGNILLENFMQRIYSVHKVHLDLAYVGCTKEHTFNVSHPNIVEVFISLSKSFGMFHERIGFWFGREMLSLMSGNMWFMSTRSAILGVALLNELGLQTLYQKYRSVQKQIVADIYTETGIPLQPSNAILLAHISQKEAMRLTGEQQHLLTEFKRGDSYRICLTPRFEEKEQRF